MKAANYHVELSDFEQVWRLAQNLAIDPSKNALYYFTPVLAAWGSGYSPIISNDYGQKSMIPTHIALNVLNEIEALRKSAGFTRAIHTYTALTHHFRSFGGSFSLTNPILTIPYHRIMRPNASPFGTDTHPTSPRTFNDDETRFLIARELGHLHFSDPLFKTFAKVGFITSFFFLYATPLGWAGSLLIAGCSLTFLFLVERVYESAIDLFAIDTLTKRTGNLKRSWVAALTVLEKSRLENLERRKRNRLCQCYITKQGNNLLDFQHPFLTTRIERIKQKLLEKNSSASLSKTGSPRRRLLS